ncbi:hypothetical protein D3C75_661790 [compost metagenome]
MLSLLDGKLPVFVQITEQSAACGSCCALLGNVVQRCKIPAFGSGIIRGIACKQVVADDVIFLADSCYGGKLRLYPG